MRRITKVSRAFSGLKVRPKLMIAHNLFFLVFAASVWFGLLPRIESGVAAARDREVQLVREIFGSTLAGAVVPVIEAYDYREGSATELEIPSQLQAMLDVQPGVVISGPSEPNLLYSKSPNSGTYRRVRLPFRDYDALLAGSKVALAVALAVVYCLAVLTLELWLMRAYIYRPVHALLRADEASRQGDTAGELIDDSMIGRDELGQIMSSRNNTLRALRQHERDLEQALEQLEQTADDLRKKNELLKTAKQNIVDQDRLASVGLLSASVAHEINTPLAVLRGSIEQMIETTNEKPSHENLERMLRMTQRLQTMSESLVDFARERRHEMAPVSIRQIIEDSWRLVAIDPKAAAVRFRNRTTAEDIAVGNQDRLVQLFVNLLRNALLAVGQGGAVEVISKRETSGANDFVVVSVVDDGPGIPEDVLPEIFEAFVTTRLDARGTGLGLMVAEGIAHQHRGSISASNRTEGGACLEVRLPAAKTAQAASTGSWSRS